MRARLLTGLVLSAACAPGRVSTPPPDDPRCGDDVRQGSESCDGSDLAGTGCVALGFATGSLACASDCLGFDVGGCTLDTCGDGARQGPELCDGEDLGAEDCVSRGFTSGLLRCAVGCLAFDTGGCATSTCGDGVLQPPEACDGSELAGRDCLGLGFAGGILGCADGCAAFDVGACTSDSCGDGAVQPPEVCDGPDLGGATCRSRGFDAGTLTCAAGCTALDESQCRRFACDDGVAEGDEACDGDDLRGQTCVTAGFDEGSLACTGCALDTGGCRNRVCGDGVADDNEVCDGDDLRDATCADRGHLAGGVLACQGDCAGYDTSACLDGETDCGDFLDDDNDGLVDCEDPTACLGLAAACVGGTTPTGGACTTGADCLSDVGDPVCFDEVRFGLPGGSCSELCTPNAGACGGGGFCVAIGGSTTRGLCVQICAAPGDCRAGYNCSGNVCVGACTSASQCPATGFCAPSGKCATAPPVCGDGVAEGDEACDGADVGVAACADHLFDAGTVACAADCRALDYAPCSFSTCGNDAIDGGETCDGPALGGADCPSVDPRFTAGTLACAPNCGAFDTSACTSPVQAWTPPLGIPTPPWPSRVDLDRPALPSPWSSEQAGFYFVSPTGCSDLRARGTPAAPRCSLPPAAPPGSVIVLDGSLGGVQRIAYAGTAQSAIWIMGYHPEARPAVLRYWDVPGSYLIFDSLAFTLNEQDAITLSGHHLMVRASSMANPYLYNGCGFAIGGQHVIFYKNVVSQMGDWQLVSESDIDRQGIKVYGGSDIWILDSAFYHCQSDGVQVGDINNTAEQINRVYIGRNLAFENLQFGFWTKNATDVIFSENVALLLHRITPSGTGGGLGGQYDPKYVWYLNNLIYDSNTAIHIAGPSDNTGGPWFAIGNLAVSIAGGDCGSYSFGAISYRNAGGFVELFNTVYDADFFGGFAPSGGIVSLANNIFAGKRNNACAAFETERSFTHDYNLYSSASYNPGLEPHRVVGDPQLVQPGTDFSLSSTSPAIDAASAAGESVFQLFQSRYGLDIRRDLAGTARPAGAAWDIGAYERVP